MSLAANASGAASADRVSHRPNTVISSATQRLPIRRRSSGSNPVSVIRPVWPAR